MLSGAVRVRFTKVGAMQFISHLDLNRTMKTVMIRAGVPIRYSEGFNPHPKMVFALPLSIGTESICELLDFKLDRPMAEGELADRLNRALPPEMRVLEVYEPQTKLTGIRYAEYLLRAEEDFSTAPLDQPSLVVRKRSKSGEKDCDIKPLIFSWQKEEKALRCVLSAVPDNYLNPEYPAALLGISDCAILRTKVLCEDGVTPFR